MKKNILTIFIPIFIAGVILGFMLGRESKSEQVIYKTQPSVTGSVTHPVAKSETTPEHPVLPIRVDTFYKDKIKYVVQTVDTAAIIDDYIKKRSYEIVAFDKPDVGKLEVKADVQYNNLSLFDYSFTPVEKTTTNEKKRVWIPFVSASWIINESVAVGGGLFYHDIGIEYQFQFHTEDIFKNGHLVSLKYKF